MKPFRSFFARLRNKSTSLKNTKGGEGRWKSVLIKYTFSFFLPKNVEKKFENKKEKSLNGAKESALISRK